MRKNLVGLILVATFLLYGAVGTVAAESRSGEGFLTSTRELAELRDAVRDGSASPLRQSHVERLITLANEPWPLGYVGKAYGTTVSYTSEGWERHHCVPLDGSGSSRVLGEAGLILYTKALAYNLTGNTNYAKEVRNRLMDFTRASGFERVGRYTNYSGGNECAFKVSSLMPLLIESATLLESYSGWHASHKRDLQRWLAGVPYRLTSAIADTRKNNWGTAAAFASWAIAHYLGDSDLSLRQHHPVSEVRTPWEAKRAHLESQMRIIGTRWKGDSRCQRYGAQWHGGFPDELRRGSTGCSGEYLRRTDPSYDYQIKIVSHLIFHAEALKRHGDNELYRYRLDSGELLLKEAIKFVINNSRGRSYDWPRQEMGMLRAASLAYPYLPICEQLERTHDFHIDEGLYIPFFRVVRGDGGC